jgi:hypothetical protein
LASSFKVPSSLLSAPFSVPAPEALPSRPLVALACLKKVATPERSASKHPKSRQPNDGCNCHSLDVTTELLLYGNNTPDL